MANDDDKLRNELEARAAQQAAQREREAVQRRKEAERQARVAAGFDDALGRLSGAVKSAQAIAVGIPAYSTLTVKDSLGTTLAFGGRSASVRKWEKLMVHYHVVVHLNDRGARHEEQWELRDADNGSDQWAGPGGVFDSDGLAKRMLDYVLGSG